MSRFTVVVVQALVLLMVGSAGCVASDTAGRIESVTVFPVRMAGSPVAPVGDALALLLEKHGVPTVTTSHTPFMNGDGAALSETADAFAKFVADQAIETDYAVYAEFHGSPSEGVKEVRTIVVTRAGRLVWADSQKPGDGDFERVNPRNPMTCCVLVQERLKPRLDSSARGRTDGPMMAMWKERSGLPPRQELEAVRQRAKTLRATKKPFDLLLLGALVDTTADDHEAGALAKALTATGVCTARTAVTGVELGVDGSSNEQKVLWSLAKTLKSHVQNTKPDADYIGYAHYLIRPSDQKVFGVHFVMCDRQGEWVMVDFQNEYQSDFKRIDPRSIADCHRLVAVRVAGAFE